MNPLALLLAGLLFGLGLVISGMSNPAKVLGFLDLFGDWDASLAFVMAGAVGVAFVGFRLVGGRKAPMFDTRFVLPERRDIDAQLIIGAGLFGIGWGLVGFCPGPAVVALSARPAETVLFFGCMLAGMGLARRIGNRPTGRETQPNPA